MNNKRPEDDQIELTGSMLPKHHCAFPNCPQYLVNLQSPADKGKDINSNQLFIFFSKAFGRRNGLFRHLKYFFLEDPKTYIKSFHQIAISCIARNTKVF